MYILTFSVAMFDFNVILPSMRRAIETTLKRWSKDPNRKPLILNGARQVGKTYSLQRLGKSEYSKTAYFNFEESPDLREAFQGELNPDKILAVLSAITGYKIGAGDDLIILDEIQLAPEAINSLKYFQEKRPEYHIACAGSLLGIHLSKPKSFPVGKVNFLNLFPMSFTEYLNAIRESGLNDDILTLDKRAPLPTIIHKRRNDHLRNYLFVGGMPEAVRRYRDTSDYQQVRQVQKEILRAYQIDFAKHPRPHDIPKISQIWASIPAHLGRENKKFMFSKVRPGARARDYEDALQWLIDGGLLLKSNNVSKAAFPLMAYANSNIFKAYLLDVGLLGAMTNLSPEVLIKNEGIFEEFKGALTENYIAQQLRSVDQENLYYWTSEQTAEIDFLYEFDQGIIPLEVKAGHNTKSKSLHVYDNKYSPKALVRSNLLNLKHDGKVLNIPLHLIEFIPIFLKLL